MHKGMLARGALAGAVFTAAAAAHAQSGNFVGLGVGVVPVYEGSDEYRVLPLPLINYHSGHFFVTPRAGLPAAGLKTTLAPDLDVGVFVGMGLGREADRTDRTRGMENIKFHGAYGAYIEWAPGRYSFGAAYKQAARSGYGGTLELRASYAAYTSPKNIVRVGAFTQWANRDAMQTWHGVTPAESARSYEGLPAYSPSAGFKNAALYTVWAYRIDSRWSALTTVGVSTVLGDARDSPLTERKTNLFGSVGVVYNF